MTSVVRGETTAFISKEDYEAAYRHIFRVEFESKRAKNGENIIPFYIKPYSKSLKPAENLYAIYSKAVSV